MIHIKIPDKFKNVGIVAFSDWNKYFAYPSIGTIRQWDFHNKYNFRKVVMRIGGKPFIKIDEFQKWLNEQDKK